MTSSSLSSTSARSGKTHVLLGPAEPLSGDPAPLRPTRSAQPLGERAAQIALDLVDPEALAHRAQGTRERRE